MIFFTLPMISSVEAIWVSFWGGLKTRSVFPPQKERERFKGVSPLWNPGAEVSYSSLFFILP